MGERGIIKKLLILSLLSFQTVFAQYQDLKFENLTSDDGLSVSWITSILQDKEGFLWFGTLDAGLNRYGGNNLKRFENIPNKKGTLSNNGILSLYEDKNGTLWVETQSGGLNKFDKTSEEFTCYMHNSDDSNSISDNCINSIYQ